MQRHKGAGHTGTEDAGAKGRRGCCLFVHNCPGNDLTEVIAVAAFVLKSHLAEEIAGYRENREKRVEYGKGGVESGGKTDWKRMEWVRKFACS